MMHEESTSTNRFRDGIKFGLGFSIPFVLLFVVGLVIMNVVQRTIIRDTFEEYGTDKTYGPNVGLEIVSHDSEQRAGNLIIRGRVRNAGPDTWNYVRLQADLLGQAETFVGMCSGRCNGPLHPGQERHFVIDCEASDKEPLPQFERYVIEIVDASYKRRDEPISDGT